MLKKPYFYNPDTLMFEPNEYFEQKMFWDRVALRVVELLLIIITSILIFTCFYFTTQKQNLNSKLELQQQEINRLNSDTFHFPLPNFSEKNLRLAIRHLGFKDTNLIFQQARLETGNFKSKYFKEYNNLFGMKNSKRQHSYCKVGVEGHVIYKHWFLSLVDRGYYEVQHKHTIGSNYSTNSEYFLILNNISNGNKSYKHKEESDSQRQTLATCL